MQPQETSLGWRTFTTVLHLLSVSVLSFCLARRSFFHLERKPLPLSLRTSIAAASHAHTRSTPLRIDTRTLDAEGAIGLLRATYRYFKSYCMSNYCLRTTVARFTTFMTLLLSLVFALASAILVNGVGLNPGSVIRESPSNGAGVGGESKPGPSCYAVIYLCILLYGMTKVCIYLFLIERVYLVACAGTTPPRLSTMAYRAGVLALLIYIGIMAVLIAGRIATVTSVSLPSPEGSSSTYTLDVCTIGLHLYAAIPLVTYDILFTMILTTLFILPLMYSRGNGGRANTYPSKLFKSAMIFQLRPISLPRISPSRHAVLSPSQSYLTSRPESINVDDFIGTEPERPSSWIDFQLEGAGNSDDLRRLAIKSLIASFVGLSVSTINLLLMIIHNGLEQGADCMRWCLLDVVINALAVYAVMQGREEWWKGAGTMRPPTESLPPGIWDVSERGSRAQNGEASKSSSLRRTRTPLTKEKSNSRLLSSGMRRLSAMAIMSRKDDPLSPAATTRRKTRCISLQVDTERARNVFVRTSLPDSPESSSRVGEDKGKGREEGWSSSSSLATIRQHSRSFDYLSASPITSPQPAAQLADTYQESTPHSPPTRHSWQQNIFGSSSAGRWSTLQRPIMERHVSYS